MAAVAVQHITPKSVSLVRDDHLHESAPIHELNELPLDEMQQQHLEKSLPTHFDYFVNKPFRLHAKLDPKVLIWHFQNLIRIWLPKARLSALPMIGSTVPDALKGEDKISSDIDFFGSIENVDSLQEKWVVENIFLEALRATLQIDAFDAKEPDGSTSTSYFHRPHRAFLIKLPKGQNLFKMREFRLLKGLICEHDIPFYARIPLYSGGKERDLDFTFGWGKDASPNCFTSRDCFTTDFLPRLIGSKNPLRVVGIKGYDAQKAWRLLNEGGFYYVNEEEAVRLRGGLRGYARTPTRGFRPVKYTSESAFFKKWENEYGAAGLARFFYELQSYLPLHYHDNLPATVAYLTNLRTIFATQVVQNKEQFLKSFDQESGKLLAVLFTAPEPDFLFLRTICFWRDFENNRLDCSEEIQESRYHFPCRSGHILAHIPWKETTELLSTTPEEIESKWASMKPFNAVLKLPKTAVNLRKNLSGSLSKLRTDPRVPLFRCLLSQDPTPDAFISLFAAALPHLDKEDIACIEKNLAIYHPHLNEIRQILSALREVPREIYFIAFLDALFTAKIPMSEETIGPLLKQAIGSAKSPPALLMAARMAAAFQQLIDGAGMERLEREILTDPAANGEALFIFLSIRRPIKTEILQKLLEAVPLVPQKERWVPFWLGQVDQNLPAPFLVSLIESPHFDRGEKIVLTRKMIQATAERRNYEAYFSCWDAAFNQQCLTQDMVPTLVSVAQAVYQNTDLIPWVIETVANMQAMGISVETVRTLFQSITPAWLEAPRNSLQCWRILQRASGREVDQAQSLDHGTRVSLLRTLFNLEAPRDILNQLFEIGRNHHPHARISISQDFIAFGKFLNTAPLFKKLTLNGDFSTLFVPLVQEARVMKEIIRYLFDPEYRSIREECLSGLLPHLMPEQLTDRNLETLLTEGPFPTPTRLVQAAIQRRLPLLKRELPTLLKQLGRENIPPSIRESSAAFFKAHPEFGLPCLEELLDLDIFPPKIAWEIGSALPHPLDHLLEFSHACVKKEGKPIPEIEEHWKRIIPSSSMPFMSTLLTRGVLSPEDLWQGASTNKRPPEEMVALSQNCLQKAGRPIPAIESFWSTAVDHPRSSLQWPLLQSLHSLPHASQEFQQTLLGAMERFIGKNGNYAQQLDPKKGLLCPLVPTVAELAVRASRGDKALELLVARDDALQSMPVPKLWGLISSLAQIERKKGAYAANFERLLQTGLTRLAEGNARETIQIITEAAARLPSSLRQTVEPRFLSLYSQEVQKLMNEPASELWNLFKPLLKNGAAPSTFKDIAIRLIFAKIETMENPTAGLRYLNLVLHAIPNQPAPPSAWALYEGLIEKIGTGAYSNTDASKIWKRLATEESPLSADTDEVHSRLERFLGYFVNFTKVGGLLAPDRFVQLALKLESFKSQSGAKCLTEYLSALNALPLSDNVAEMAARSAYWTLACANFSRCATTIWDIVPLVNLHRNAIISTEHRALGFLSLQHSVMSHIESLAQRGIKARTLFEQVDLTRHIDLFHDYFMDFYKWVAQQRDLQSDYLQICELISTGKSEMQIPLTNKRILYHAMYIHLHMLAAVRLVFKEGASRNMDLAQEVLDFTIKNPFTIQPQEIVPFLQICADISLDGDDLCKLLDRVQPFVIHGCNGPAPHEKFLSVPTFISWLKQNLMTAGLEDTSTRITQYAMRDKGKKLSPEEAKVTGPI